MVERFEVILPREVYHEQIALLPRPNGGRCVVILPERIDTTAPIAYTVLDEPVPAGEASGVYLPYRPSRIIIPAAHPHSTDPVESLAMGSITALRPTYRPEFPAHILEEAILSDA